eukprot:TRINITY_DN14128_c0_g1_i1.p1 TRINITY_DN14128_c0_g1~~TRINITY_DN14128_c0_g1_i1.p1  ORF type:complete len:356 (-),score=57.12 TRINITY_DN14128_c0_g1_i1:188-1255(-)
MARTNLEPLNFSLAGSSVELLKRKARLKPSRVRPTQMVPTGRSILNLPCHQKPRMQKAHEKPTTELAAEASQAHSSTPEVPMVIPEIQLVVSLLSGESTSLKLLETATSQDLRDAIAAKFSIPAKQQKLIVGDVELPAGVSLGASGVGHDSQITVVKVAVPQLATPSPKFKVNLVCAHERLKQRAPYSGFTMVYDLELDLEADHIKVQVLRRDDSDWCTFDGQKGKVEGEMGHWMSGSTAFQHDCQPFSLSKLLSSWMARADPVLDSSEFLWTEKDREERDDFFKLPSPACFELHVDAPLQLGRLGRHHSDVEVRLRKVLVDSAGWPLRVALEERERCLDKRSALHEYDVTLMAT